MNWLIPALLAPAIYALVVFIDKYLLEKHIKDYRGMPIFSAIAGFVAGTIIWLLTGQPILSMGDTILVLATGVLTTISFASYYEAVSLEEASRVNLLFQMFPVLVLGLSALFLKEIITAKQILGFILVLSAALAASWDKPKKRSPFRLSKAFFLILFYDLLLAVSAILMKFVIVNNSFSKVLAYQSWGVGLGGIVLLLATPTIRTSFLKTFKGIRVSTLAVIFTNEIVFISGRLLTYLAFSLGPIALVSVLEGTQVFWGIFYGILVTLLTPKILRENISRKSLQKKVILAIILILGIVLIT